MENAESSCSDYKRNIEQKFRRHTDANSDDKPEDLELMNHDLDNNEKNELVAESSDFFANDPKAESRTRKPTEKGQEERVWRLKQNETTALSAVSRKRTDITNL